MDYKIIIDKNNPENLKLKIDDTDLGNIKAVYIENEFLKIYVGDNNKIKVKLKQLKQLSKKSEVKKLLDHITNQIDNTTYICMVDYSTQEITLKFYLDKTYIIFMRKNKYLDGNEYILEIAVDNELSEYIEHYSSGIEKICEELKELKKETIDLKYCVFKTSFDTFFNYLLTKVKVNFLMKEVLSLLLFCKFLNKCLLTTLRNISKLHIPISDEVKFFKKVLSFNLEKKINKEINKKIKNGICNLFLKIKDNIKEQLYKKIKNMVESDKDNEIIFNNDFFYSIYDELYDAKLETKNYEIWYEYSNPDGNEEYHHYDVDLKIKRRIKRLVEKDKVIINIIYDKKIYEYLLLTMLLIIGHFIVRSKIIYPNIKEVRISVLFRNARIKISFEEHNFHQNECGIESHFVCIIG